MIVGKSGKRWSLFSKVELEWKIIAKSRLGWNGPRGIYDWRHSLFVSIENFVGDFAELLSKFVLHELDSSYIDEHKFAFSRNSLQWLWTVLNSRNRTDKYGFEFRDLFKWSFSVWNNHNVFFKYLFWFYPNFFVSFFFLLSDRFVFYWFIFLSFFDF